jgi:pyridoxal 5'-phosphate synthase pdxT subunit
MRIGVLALQGDFHEHQVMLEQVGVSSVQVRLPSQLEGLDGLILPGGESTTIGKLAVAYGLLEPLREFGRSQAIWGTCAGMILLAQSVGRDQPVLGLMDMTVERNAFGRQVQSFEVDLDLPFLKGLNGNNGAYHAAFIRAPVVSEVHGRARALSTLPDGRIVVAQQGKLLATSFHPELTGDHRFHRYFVELSK